ncbi:MAG: ComF family protein [Pyrinomonadaceae bacterium]|nr:ComF family protein [Pyrinomonadaceae bacterium]
MWLNEKTSYLYDAALALLYPQGCAICGRSVEARIDGIACADCWAATRIFSEDDSLCWKCGALAPGKVAEDRREQVRCRRCDDEHFTAARACGGYEGALRASVLALKREPNVSRRLAELLLATQSRAPLNKATLIIPLPLHPQRTRERGFNQAAILGRALAHLSGLPLDEWSVARQVHTERHRAGMDVRARRETVAGAFKVERPRLVEGERILLIDDVFTTGATVSACAFALKEAGATDVFVLTVARPVG